MPRFYFHVFDGKAIIDGEGTDLPDLDTARLHAVEIASSLLRGSIKQWPGKHGWRVVVVDGRRNVIATLVFGVEQNEDTLVAQREC